MAWKRRNPNFMDLEEARRIGARPITARLPRWRRAFRILTRWAEEPCTRKEFDKRLKLCRNVYVCILEVEEAERQRELEYAEMHKAAVKRKAKRQLAKSKKEPAGGKKSVGGKQGRNKVRPNATRTKAGKGKGPRSGNATGRPAPRRGRR